MTADNELDADILRQAFGAFATSVTVIGTRADNGALIGMTVHSSTSVLKLMRWNFPSIESLAHAALDSY